MLVDINFNMQRDAHLLNILDMIAEVNNNEATVQNKSRGVYEIGHFGFDHEIGLTSRDPWECRYPNLTVVENAQFEPLEGTVAGAMLIKLAPFVGGEEVVVREVGYIGCYGVCDKWEQVVALCAELQDTNPDPYVLSITPIVKAEQESEGGWRWHKWGEYIGIHDPQCEYIYDEPKVEKVYCYHVYRIPERMRDSIMPNVPKQIVEEVPKQLNN